MITIFSIEVETVVATDDSIFTRVHWNHQPNGKRFDQHGIEMYRMNAEGQIAEFWALMRDTAAFDEFFA